MIYVGLGSCGLAAGAGDVLEAVRAHLGDRGVEARIVTVGCIGPCYLEPLLDVQLPGRPRLSYSNMTPELAVKTLDALLAGEVPKRHLLGSLDGDLRGSGTGRDGRYGLRRCARFADHPMLAHADAHRAAQLRHHRPGGHRPLPGARRLPGRRALPAHDARRP